MPQTRQRSKQTPLKGSKAKVQSIAKKQTHKGLRQKVTVTKVSFKDISFLLSVKNRKF